MSNSNLASTMVGRFQPYDSDAVNTFHNIGYDRSDIATPSKYPNRIATIIPNQSKTSNLSSIFSNTHGIVSTNKGYPSAFGWTAETEFASVVNKLTEEGGYGYYSNYFTTPFLFNKTSFSYRAFKRNRNLNIYVSEGNPWQTVYGSSKSVSGFKDKDEDGVLSANLEVAKNFNQDLDYPRFFLRGNWDNTTGYGEAEFQVHGKMLLMKTPDGQYFTRIETSTLGAAFGAVGSMGVGMQDMHYQTTNPEIGREAEQYFTQLHKGEFYQGGKYLLTRKSDIYSRLTQDINESTGKVFIHGASLDRNVDNVMGALINAKNRGQDVKVYSSGTRDTAETLRYLDLQGIETSSELTQYPGAFLNINLFGKRFQPSMPYSIGRRIEKLAGLHGSEHYNFFFVEKEDEVVVYLGTGRLEDLIFKYEGGEKKEVGAILETTLRISSKDDPNIIKMLEMAEGRYKPNPITNVEKWTRLIGSSRLLEPQYHSVKQLSKSQRYLISESAYKSASMPYYSISLPEDYYKKYTLNTLPHLKTFQSLYSSRTGFGAPQSILALDRAISRPSFGQRLNMMAQFQVYEPGQGLVGSTVSTIGKGLDKLFGFNQMVDWNEQARDPDVWTIQQMLAELRRKPKEQKGQFESIADTLYSFTAGTAVAIGTYVGVNLPLRHLTNIFEESYIESLLEPTSGVAQTLKRGQRRLAFGGAYGYLLNLAAENNIELDTTTGKHIGVKILPRTPNYSARGMADSTNVLFNLLRDYRTTFLGKARKDIEFADLTDEEIFTKLGTKQYRRKFNAISTEVLNEYSDDSQAILQRFVGGDPNRLSTLKREVVMGQHTGLSYYSVVSYFRQFDARRFESVLAPILEAMNPYDPKSQSAIHSLYRAAIKETHDTIGAMAALQLVSQEGGGFTLKATNTGTHRTREIAKVFDRIGALLPMNMAYWIPGVRKALNLPNFNIRSQATWYDIFPLERTVRQVEAATANLSKSIGLNWFSKPHPLGRAGQLAFAIGSIPAATIKSLYSAVHLFGSQARLSWEEGKLLRSKEYLNVINEVNKPFNLDGIETVEDFDKALTQRYNHAEKTLEALQTKASEWQRLKLMVDKEFSDFYSLRGVAEGPTQNLKNPLEEVPVGKEHLLLDKGIWSPTKAKTENIKAMRRGLGLLGAVLLTDATLDFAFFRSGVDIFTQISARNALRPKNEYGRTEDIAKFKLEGTPSTALSVGMAASFGFAAGLLFPYRAGGPSAPAEAVSNTVNFTDQLKALKEKLQKTVSIASQFTEKADQRQLLQVAQVQFQEGLSNVTSDLTKAGTIRMSYKAMWAGALIGLLGARIAASTIAGVQSFLYQDDNKALSIRDDSTIISSFAELGAMQAKQQGQEYLSAALDHVAFMNLKSKDSSPLYTYNVASQTTLPFFQIAGLARFDSTSQMFTLGVGLQLTPTLGQGASPILPIGYRLRGGRVTTGEYKEQVLSEIGALDSWDNFRLAGRAAIGHFTFGDSLAFAPDSQWLTGVEFIGTAAITSTLAKKVGTLLGATQIQKIPFIAKELNTLDEFASSMPVQLTKALSYNTSRNLATLPFFYGKATMDAIPGGKFMASILPFGVLAYGLTKSSGLIQDFEGAKFAGFLGAGLAASALSLTPVGPALLRAGKPYYLGLLAARMLADSENSYKGYKTDGAREEFEATVGIGLSLGALWSGTGTFATTESLKGAYLSRLASKHPGGIQDVLAQEIMEMYPHVDEAQLRKMIQEQSADIAASTAKGKFRQFWLGDHTLKEMALGEVANDLVERQIKATGAGQMLIDSSGGFNRMRARLTTGAVVWSLLGLSSAIVSDLLPAHTRESIYNIPFVGPSLKVLSGVKGDKAYPTDVEPSVGRFTQRLLNALTFNVFKFGTYLDKPDPFSPSLLGYGLSFKDSGIAGYYQIASETTDLSYSAFSLARISFSDLDMAQSIAEAPLGLTPYNKYWLMRSRAPRSTPMRADSITDLSMEGATPLVSRAIALRSLEQANLKWQRVSEIAMDTYAELTFAGLTDSDRLAKKYKRWHPFRAMADSKFYVGIPGKDVSLDNDTATLFPKVSTRMKFEKAKLPSIVSYSDALEQSVYTDRLVYRKLSMFGLLGDLVGKAATPAEGITQGHSNTALVGAVGLIHTTGLVLGGFGLISSIASVGRRRSDLELYEETFAAKGKLSSSAGRYKFMSKQIEGKTFLAQIDLANPRMAFAITDLNQLFSTADPTQVPSLTSTLIGEVSSTHKAINQQFQSFFQNEVGIYIDKYAQKIHDLYQLYPSGKGKEFKEGLDALGAVKEIDAVKTEFKNVLRNKLRTLLGTTFSGTKMTYAKMMFGSGLEVEEVLEHLLSPKDGVNYIDQLVEDITQAAKTFHKEGKSGKLRLMARMSQAAKSSGLMFEARLINPTGKSITIIEPDDSLSSLSSTYTTRQKAFINSTAHRSRYRAEQQVSLGGKVWGEGFLDSIGSFTRGATTITSTYLNVIQPGYEFLEGFSLGMDTSQPYNLRKEGYEASILYTGRNILAMGVVSGLQKVPFLKGLPALAVGIGGLIAAQKHLMDNPELAKGQFEAISAAADTLLSMDTSWTNPVTSRINKFTSEVTGPWLAENLNNPKNSPWKSTLLWFFFPMTAYTPDYYRKQSQRSYVYSKVLEASSVSHTPRREFLHPHLRGALAGSQLEMAYQARYFNSYAGEGRILDDFGVHNYRISNLQMLALQLRQAETDQMITGKMLERQLARDFAAPNRPEFTTKDWLKLGTNLAIGSLLSTLAKPVISSLWTNFAVRGADFVLGKFNGAYANKVFGPKFAAERSARNILKKYNVNLKDAPNIVYGGIFNKYTHYDANTHTVYLGHKDARLLSKQRSSLHSQKVGTVQTIQRLEYRIVHEAMHHQVTKDFDRDTSSIQKVLSVLQQNDKGFGTYTEDVQRLSYQSALLAKQQAELAGSPLSKDQFNRILAEELEANRLTRRAFVSSESSKSAKPIEFQVQRGGTTQTVTRTPVKSPLKAVVRGIGYEDFADDGATTISGRTSGDVQPLAEMRQQFNETLATLPDSTAPGVTPWNVRYAGGFDSPSGNLSPKTLKGAQMDVIYRPSQLTEFFDFKDFRTQELLDTLERGEVTVKFTNISQGGKGGLTVAKYDSPNKMILVSPSHALDSRIGEETLWHESTHALQQLQNKPVTRQITLENGKIITDVTQRIEVIDPTQGTLVPNAKAIKAWNLEKSQYPEPSHPIEFEARAVEYSPQNRTNVLYMIWNKRPDLAPGDYQRGGIYQSIEERPKVGFFGRLLGHKKAGATWKPSPSGSNVANNLNESIKANSGTLPESNTQMLPSSKSTPKSLTEGRSGTNTPESKQSITPIIEEGKGPTVAIPKQPSVNQGGSEAANKLNTPSGKATQQTIPTTPVEVITNSTGDVGKGPTVAIPEQPSIDKGSEVANNVNQRIEESTGVEIPNSNDISSVNAQDGSNVANELNHGTKAAVVGKGSNASSLGNDGRAKALAAKQAAAVIPPPKVLPKTRTFAEPTVNFLSDRSDNDVLMGSGQPSVDIPTPRQTDTLHNLTAQARILRKRIEIIHGRKGTARALEDRLFRINQQISEQRKSSLVGMKPSEITLPTRQVKGTTFISKYLRAVKADIQDDLASLMGVERTVKAVSDIGKPLQIGFAAYDLYATSKITKRSNYELRLLEMVRKGRSAREIRAYYLKHIDPNNTNPYYIANLEAIASAGGKITEEQKKLLLDSYTNIRKGEGITKSATVASVITGILFKNIGVSIATSVAVSVGFSISPDPFGQHRRQAQKDYDSPTAAVGHSLPLSSVLKTHKDLPVIRTATQTLTSSAIESIGEKVGPPVSKLASNPITRTIGKVGLTGGLIGTALYSKQQRKELLRARWDTSEQLRASYNNNYEQYIKEEIKIGAGATVSNVLMTGGILTGASTILQGVANVVGWASGRASKSKLSPKALKTFKTIGGMFEALAWLPIGAPATAAAAVFTVGATIVRGIVGAIGWGINWVKSFGGTPTARKKFTQETVERALAAEAKREAARKASKKAAEKSIGGRLQHGLKGFLGNISTRTSEWAIGLAESSEKLLRGFDYVGGIDNFIKNTVTDSEFLGLGRGILNWASEIPFMKPLGKWVGKNFTRLVADPIANLGKDWKTLSTLIPYFAENSKRAILRSKPGKFLNTQVGQVISRSGLTDLAMTGIGGAIDTWSWYSGWKGLSKTEENLKSIFDKINKKQKLTDEEKELLVMHLKESYSSMGAGSGSMSGGIFGARAFGGFILLRGVGDVVGGIHGAVRGSHAYRKRAEQAAKRLTGESVQVSRFYGLWKETKGPTTISGLRGEELQEFTTSVVTAEIAGRGTNQLLQAGYNKFLSKAVTSYGDDIADKVAKNLKLTKTEGLAKVFFDAAKSQRAVEASRKAVGAIDEATDLAPLAKVSQAGSKALRALGGVTRVAGYGLSALTFGYGFVQASKGKTEEDREAGYVLTYRALYTSAFSEAGALGGSVFGPVGGIVGGVSGAFLGDYLGKTQGRRIYRRIEEAREQGVDISTEELIKHQTSTGLASGAVGGSLAAIALIAIGGMAAVPAAPFIAVAALTSAAVGFTVSGDMYINEQLYRKGAKQRPKANIYQSNPIGRADTQRDFTTPNRQTDLNFTSGIQLSPGSQNLSFNPVQPSASKQVSSAKQIKPSKQAKRSWVDWLLGIEAASARDINKAATYHSNIKLQPKNIQTAKSYVLNQVFEGENTNSKLFVSNIQTQLYDEGYYPPLAYSKDKKQSAELKSKTIDGIWGRQSDRALIIKIQTQLYDEGYYPPSVYSEDKKQSAELKSKTIDGIWGKQSDAALDSKRKAGGKILGITLSSPDDLFQVVSQTSNLSYKHHIDKNVEPLYFRTYDGSKVQRLYKAKDLREVFLSFDGNTKFYIKMDPARLEELRGQGVGTDAKNPITMPRSTNMVTNLNKYTSLRIKDKDTFVLPASSENIFESISQLEDRGLYIQAIIGTTFIEEGGKRGGYHYIRGMTKIDNLDTSVYKNYDAAYYTTKEGVTKYLSLSGKTKEEIRTTLGDLEARDDILAISTAGVSNSTDLDDYKGGGPKASNPIMVFGKNKTLLGVVYTSNTDAKGQLQEAQLVFKDEVKYIAKLDGDFYSKNVIKGGNAHYNATAIWFQNAQLIVSSRKTEHSEHIKSLISEKSLSEYIETKVNEQFSDYTDADAINSKLPWNGLGGIVGKSLAGFFTRNKQLAREMAVGHVFHNELSASFRESFGINKKSDLHRLISKRTDSPNSWFYNNFLSNIPIIGDIFFPKGMGISSINTPSSEVLVSPAVRHKKTKSGWFSWLWGKPASASTLPDDFFNSNSSSSSSSTSSSATKSSYTFGSDSYANLAGTSLSAQAKKLFTVTAFHWLAEAYSSTTRWFESPLKFISQGIIQAALFTDNSMLLRMAGIRASSFTATAANKVSTAALVSWNWLKDKYLAVASLPSRLWAGLTGTSSGSSTQNQSSVSLPQLPPPTTPSTSGPLPVPSSPPGTGGTSLPVPSTLPGTGGTSSPAPPATIPSPPNIPGNRPVLTPPPLPPSTTPGSNPPPNIGNVPSPVQGPGGYRQPFTGQASQNLVNNIQALKKQYGVQFLSTPSSIPSTQVSTPASPNTNQSTYQVPQVPQVQPAAYYYNGVLIGNERFRFRTGRGVSPAQTGAEFKSMVARYDQSIANKLNQGPGDRGSRFHYGIDWITKQGTPLYNPFQRAVVEVQPNWGAAGNAVLIHEVDAQGKRTGVHVRFFHLSKFSVSNGQTVNQGAQVGLVGSTGRSTTPHLHFEYFENGKRVDIPIWSFLGSVTNKLTTVGSNGIIQQTVVSTTQQTQVSRQVSYPTATMLDKPVVISREIVQQAPNTTVTSVTNLQPGVNQQVTIPSAYTFADVVMRPQGTPRYGSQVISIEKTVEQIGVVQHTVIPTKTEQTVANLPGGIGGNYYYGDKPITEVIKFSTGSGSNATRSGEEIRSAVSRYDTNLARLVGEGFGWREWGRRNHLGIDIRLGAGQPLYSPFQRAEAVTSYTALGGNGITLHEIDEAGGRTGQQAGYIHLSKYPPNINGQVVGFGTVVGYVGNTGTSSRGPHSHFFYKINGEFADVPLGVLMAGHTNRVTLRSSTGPAAPTVNSSTSTSDTKPPDIISSSLDPTRPETSTKPVPEVASSITPQPQTTVVTTSSDSQVTTQNLTRTTTRTVSSYTYPIATTLPRLSGSSTRSQDSDSLPFYTNPSTTPTNTTTSSSPRGVISYDPTVVTRLYETVETVTEQPSIVITTTSSSTQVSEGYTTGEYAASTALLGRPSAVYLPRKESASWRAGQSTRPTRVVLVAGHQADPLTGSVGTMPLKSTVNYSVPYDTRQDRYLESAVAHRTTQILARRGKELGFDVSIMAPDSVARGEGADVALAREFQRLQQAENQGAYAVSIHYDTAEGSSGVIPPVRTDQISSLDSALAQNFGAFSQNHRGGLGGPKRGITLLELGPIDANVTRAFQKGLKTGDYTEFDTLVAGYADLFWASMEQGGLPRSSSTPISKPTPTTNYQQALLIQQAPQPTNTSSGSGLVLTSTTKTTHQVVSGDPTRSRTFLSSIPISALAPLKNLIIQGESASGRENAIHILGRGASTFQVVFGKPASSTTLDELGRRQDSPRVPGAVHASGWPQIIGSTRQKAERGLALAKSTTFSESTQDLMFKWLIFYKRPEIGLYLIGRTDNLDEAAQGLAREWAAFGLAYAEAPAPQVAAGNVTPSSDHYRQRSRGQSLYAGIHGNKASISPDRAAQVLRQIRSQYDQNPTLQRSLITMYESSVGYNTNTSSSSPASPTAPNLTTTQTNLIPQAINVVNNLQPTVPSPTGGTPQQPVVKSGLPDLTYGYERIGLLSKELVESGYYRTDSMRDRAALAATLLIGGVEFLPKGATRTDFYTGMGGGGIHQGFAQFGPDHHSQVNTKERYIAYISAMMHGRRRTPTGGSTFKIDDLVKMVQSGQIRSGADLMAVMSTYSGSGGQLARRNELGLSTYDWEALGNNSWTRVPGLADDLYNYIIRGGSGQYHDSGAASELQYQGTIASTTTTQQQLIEVRPVVTRTTSVLGEVQVPSVPGVSLEVPEGTERLESSDRMRVVHHRQTSDSTVRYYVDVDNNLLTEEQRETLRLIKYTSQIKPQSSDPSLINVRPPQPSNTGLPVPVITRYTSSPQVPQTQQGIVPNQNRVRPENITTVQQFYDAYRTVLGLKNIQDAEAAIRVATSEYKYSATTQATVLIATRNRQVALEDKLEVIGNRGTSWVGIVSGPGEYQVWTDGSYARVQLTPDVIRKTAMAAELIATGQLQQALQQGWGLAEPLSAEGARRVINSIAFSQPASLWSGWRNDTADVRGGGLAHRHGTSKRKPNIINRSGRYTRYAPMINFMEYDPTTGLKRTQTRSDVPTVNEYKAAVEYDTIQTQSLDDDKGILVASADLYSLQLPSSLFAKDIEKNANSYSTLTEAARVTAKKRYGKGQDRIVLQALSLMTPMLANAEFVDENFLQLLTSRIIQETDGLRTARERYDVLPGTEHLTVEEKRHAYFEKQYGGILGNTQKGWGGTYYGRGLLQLTGRYNYEQFQKYLDSKKISKNVLESPDLLVTDPLVMAYSVLFFIEKNPIGYKASTIYETGKNSDVSKFVKIINGGQNGLGTTEKIYKEIIKELETQWDKLKPKPDPIHVGQDTNSLLASVSLYGLELSTENRVQTQSFKDTNLGKGVVFRVNDVDLSAYISSFLESLKNGSGSTTSDIDLSSYRKRVVHPSVFLAQAPSANLSSILTSVRRVVTQATTDINIPSVIQVIQNSRRSSPDAELIPLVTEFLQVIAPQLKITNELANPQSQVRAELENLVKEVNKTAEEAKGVAVSTLNEVKGIVNRQGAMLVTDPNAVDVSSLTNMVGQLRETAIKATVELKELERKAMERGSLQLAKTHPELIPIVDPAHVQDPPGKLIARKEKTMKKTTFFIDEEHRWVDETAYLSSGVHVHTDFALNDPAAF